MNAVPPVSAALAGLFVLVVPGLVLLALLPERDKKALALDEALFLGVAVSVGLSAWLGLVLAELGRFSLVTAGALLGAACLLSLLLGRSRLGWPFARPVAWPSLLPTLGIVALAIALQAKPSQYIVGGRDPGAYVAAMALIGRTGSILYTDLTVTSVPKEDIEVFFRNPDRDSFSFARFMGFDLERPETGRVVPQFFHLFPAFGAYLFQAMGLKGALAAPPILAILGTLAVFFALRRVFVPQVALLGGLLLGVNVVQVWFARYPVSEPFSQLLVFLGLLAVAHWEERRSAAFAALAGAALGLSLLVRVDSILIAVPIVLYALIRRARRDLTWKELTPFLGAFAALAVHTAVHAQLFASKYVQDIVSRRYWRQPGWVWAALAVAGLATLAAAEPLGRRLSHWLARHELRLRYVLVGTIVVLAAYAYFVRPQLSAWAGGDGNVPGAALESPQLLRWLAFHKLAAHDAQAFYRLGWFVSRLGLVLGLLGVLVTIRDFRARYLFPLLVALTFSLFYFYKIRVWNDYYFSLRRFVPVVLPFLFGFAALFLVRLARAGGLRRALAAALSLTLIWLYWQDTRRIAKHVDWKGTVDFVREVSRRFGPEDAVIFEQPRSIHLLSLPLWSAHGVNVLELARFNPDPQRLQHLIRAWRSRSRYRNIYFVHTYSSDLCGVFLQRSEALGFETVEWERSYRWAPRRPETRALYFTISRVLLPEELQVPALDDVDVGGSDDFQVSGFFDKEGGGEHTYRWTGPCGSIYLPGAKPGAVLTLVASVGRRPDAPAVRVSLSGVSLGSFTPGHAWGQHALQLPDPLPPGPPLLRLDVKAFRPKNVDPRSEDTRDLGVMIDRVQLQAPRGARATMRAPTDGGAR